MSNLNIYNRYLYLDVKYNNQHVELVGNTRGSSNRYNNSYHPYILACQDSSSYIHYSTGCSSLLVLIKTDELEGSSCSKVNNIIVIYL